MSIKRKLLDALISSSYYPHIYFFKVPFKTIEWYAMLKGVQFSPEDKVLDIGSGLGLQTALLAQKAGEVIGIDPQENAVNVAKSEQHQLDPQSKIDFRCTTIEQAGLPNDHFDKVFSVCVLEHVPDYMSVLRESLRVLKPGGQLVFSVDSLATIASQQAVERHRERYAVCRYFDPATLKRDLEVVGFSHVSVVPFLKSKLAAKWFEQAIWKEFSFRYIEAWWKYQVLRLIEPFYAGRSEGIYLLVKAQKPSM
jgi:ubiquinone/menaquinone biosynthesis C-methylase UbiE